MYIVESPVTITHRVVLRVSGADRELTTLPQTGGRDVLPGDDQSVQFSPDGRYFFVLDTVADAGSGEQSQLQVRDRDGKFLFGPPGTPSKGPVLGEPVWSQSANRLYYQDADGVHMWDAANGHVSIVFPGLHWYHPSISADGQLVAYSRIDVQQSPGHYRETPSVEAADLKTQAVVFSRVLRWWPVFVTGHTLWYQEEQSCTDSCPAGGLVGTGKLLAYDLTTRLAMDLPISGVLQLAVSAG